MTPPAAVVPTTAVPAAPPAPHLRAVRAPEAPAWRCDNCELPNADRRRRCSDCGTSRY